MGCCLVNFTRSFEIVRRYPRYIMVLLITLSTKYKCGGKFRFKLEKWLFLYQHSSFVSEPRDARKLYLMSIGGEGEGDPHPLYLRPTNNVIKWHLRARHALTHIDSTTIFPSGKSLNLAMLIIDKCSINLDFLKRHIICHIINLIIIFFLVILMAEGIKCENL